ncbi:hypothetical protein [Halalkalibacterium halodurans]|uniref:hypothetical protein n=1 Tax=Halalkalibacterium halodurans TaxID=86665 RepID=UPI002AA9E598|nr:hypothetical protein [Halalkalibacterium halodurans]MDY7224601.1 hypothetical protein [Halalkalibacterium halodurans]MDY7240724.1 hypothetical protein [Halalkalibacterium halodurans]
MSAISAYVYYRFPGNTRLGTYFFVFTVGAGSLTAINLYGIQALADEPFYQGVYINILWGQLFLILFAWTKWIPIHTRKRVAQGVTIGLGAFFLFHGPGVMNAWNDGGLYVWLFKDAAQALIWPGFALFFSGIWTRVIMAAGIDIDITPEERAREIQRYEAEKEAQKRKLSEEMLSSGRYLEYGELDYPIESIDSYREKGSTTFEDVEFLYRENDIRYFSRIKFNPPKEMILYQENGQWYCQTAGQEPEKVLLPESTIKTEEKLRPFEDDKRAYLKRAIRERLEVPHFVEVPDDIDESKIERYK